eukprot:1475803-Pyramimonas_sp.AAC.1
MNKIRCSASCPFFPRPFRSCRETLLLFPETVPPARVSLPIGSLANLSSEVGPLFVVQRARDDRELHWGAQRHQPR